MASRAPIRAWAAGLNDATLITVVGEALGSRGPHTLEGQLRDDAGQPVAGARICLDDEHATLTREDGFFTFSGVAAGLHRLTAHKGDGCTDLTLVMMQAARRTVVLTMRPGITLRVYVRGPDGPLVGASLYDAGKQVVCVTDAEGVGVVRGVGANFQMFEVIAADHAPAFLSMSLARDAGGTIERTVTLARGAPLGGIVLAPDGSPVPDATVRIWGDWGGEAMTDASGRWRFDAVAADTYQVRASARTYAAAPAVIATTDGSTAQTDLVVRVRSGAQLTGSVRDGRGEPVPGASIEVTRTEEEFPVARSYPANQAGEFAIPGLEPGTYDVFAHDPARASPETRVVLAEGEARAIDLVVARAAIAGVVIDGAGRPVVGAAVRVDATAVRGDVTDTDGRFDLGALPPGEYQVSARWAGADEGARARNARVAAGVRDATIVLPASATITARVRFNGAPMRFFGAQLTRCPRFPWIGDPVGVRDPDGRLALRGVPAGTWAVVLAGPGTAMHTISEILVEEGATIDLGEIHMPRGQRIAGIVRDADGAPVGAARVVIGRRGLDETYQADPLRQWFECEFETLTNADGTFLFDGVTSLHPPHARPTPISAFHPERGTSVGIPVPPGDATLELTLVATGSIEGVVTGFTGFTGFPGGYVAVAAHRSGEPADLRSARVQPSGTFRLDRMPPGTYTLVMTRMPRKPVAAPVQVTVTANACTRAELVMPADEDAGADGGACGVY